MAQITALSASSDIPPTTLAYASSITPDAAAASFYNVTATGDLTINPPSNPVAGYVVQVAVLASGGQRTVSFASGIRRFSDLASSYAVAQNQLLRCSLEYSSLLGTPAWVLTALGVTS